MSQLTIMKNNRQRFDNCDFSIRILFLWWPCALFDSGFWIILEMSPGVNFKLNKRFSVKEIRSVGNKLLFFINEYCLTKKVSKSFAFSLKSVTKSQSCSREKEVMIGISLLFKRRLSNDQQILELFSILYNLFATLSNIALWNNSAGFLIFLEEFFTFGANHSFCYFCESF